MLLMADNGETRELVASGEYADSMAVYMDYVLAGCDDEFGEVTYREDPDCAMAYRQGRRVLWIPPEPAPMYSERYRDAAAAARAVEVRFAE